ncbi:LacI family DNA-binding transcriptional regulator [Sinorhizobium sp. BJ1]|jgi:LacI family transcriptional regulator|uniref:LacI family DNA-binding transcriptional regulator n=1 Tax=Sinorhizobium sp. BJ1 TaxID=2035455 RepID=UPI000BE8C2BF|nr:LacI family DNA-binding transcriptional regulator [Sinorhizobium sp. BJ1]PDT82620.1 LacI family transcriptional regulator [Sinorhizobium sp. BJ1]
MDEHLPRKPSVTVADVARAANVSKATAARVLGGYGTVSDGVRENVLQAARRLDYRPNELARSMTTGRSGTIGVVVGDIENPFFSAAVRGIADIAKTAGFNVILANSGEDIEAEKAAVKTLLAKRVDGLIVTPSRARETSHLEDVVRSGRPLALLDRAIPGLSVDAVTVDDREAAEAATELLIGRGHRKIAYITACDTPEHRYATIEDIHTASVRLRIEGFLAACQRARILDPTGLIRLGANGRAETRKLALELLGSHERPTAILASDSLIALEVFKVIRELSLRIPDDVSLITFHDADWTSVTTPPITVVDQPVYRLGEAVAKLLVARMKGEAAEPRHIVLPTTLISRASVSEATSSN